MTPITPEAQKLAKTDLHAAGLRMTAARVKVLAALLSARHALSHQDIQAVADLDRVTLYRALASLTDAGLAHKIAGDDRISRYGAMSKQDKGAVAHHSSPRHGSRRHSHGHFQCTRCMRIFCLDQNRETGLLEDLFLLAEENNCDSRPEPLQTLLERTLGDGFQSHDIELIVKGWCADCAR